MIDVSRLVKQLGGDQAEWAVRYRYDGPLYTHKLCLDENGAVYLWSKHRDESGVHAAVWHGRDREYDIPHSVDLDQMKCNLDEITNLCQRIHDGLSVDWNGSNNVGTLSEDALQAEEELRELLVDVNNQHHYEIAGEDWPPVASWGQRIQRAARPYRKDKMDIRETDWLTTMQSLQAGSVHAVVTDPAYWTLDKYRETGTTTRLGGHHDPTMRGGWFNTITSYDLLRVVCEFYRVLPKDGHAWVMSDGQTLGYILGSSEVAGFDYCKPYPVIKMTKDGSSIKRGMGYHGRASHEYVTLLEKGRRRFNDENWPDVFQIPWTGAAETRPFTDDGKPYPTAKPLSLMQRLIELSTNEGEVVCDPFLGSGTTAVACVSLGRSFVGGDCNPVSVAVADRRIAHRKGLL